MSFACLCPHETENLKTNAQRNRKRKKQTVPRSIP